MTNLRLLSGDIDGAFPYAGLMQAMDGYLYGTAESGGADFQGSIFRMSLSGTLSSLFSFPFGASGANPYGRLIQTEDGSFYGTTEAGGAYGLGTLFRIANNSVSFFYSFTGGNDGAQPLAGLMQGRDGNFYGTANQGGTSAYGSVFKMYPNGAVAALYGFTGGLDGAYPCDDLIQGTDRTLYGTAIEGGAGGYGTVFALTPRGAHTTLISFNYANGAYPQAGVILGADGNLYGTTAEGGTSGYGTVFCLTTNGALSTLFSFGYTNGCYPLGALVQGTDGKLYGTTSSGGVGGQGTAFSISTNGMLATLIWFNGLNGANPQAALVQATDGNFYGTTPQGGADYNPSAGGGNGTIFRLTVPIFTNSVFTVASGIAGLPYLTNLTGRAVAPQGDTLAYAKVRGPAWLNVAANGVLSGTPSNTDIGTNVFAVSLTDSNGVIATATMKITVTADPPPSFIRSPFTQPQGNVFVAYTSTIATNATAPYLAAGDVLSFAKVSGPGWLNVATNGFLSGTPGGSNAGANLFVVSVTDLGGSSNTATMSIFVTCSPVFTQVANQFTAAGQLLTISNVAQVVAPPVTFSLDSSAPVGASVTADGAFQWTPACAQGSSTNLITIWAIDSGSPPSSNSMSFLVVVGECVQTALGNAVLQTGQSACVPMNLVSTVGLTNLSFTLAYPNNRFTNVTITVLNGAIGSSSVQYLDPAHTFISLHAASGQVVQGPTLIGSVCLSATPGPSGYVPLGLANISATKSDGSLAGNVSGQPGSVVVIGNQPLLNASLGTNSTRTLTLYGNPGVDYQILSETNLTGTNWLLLWDKTQTNLSEIFNVDPSLPRIFYRARESSP
jgi:uncharacterized repeat protein (TIGR03803 family)